MPTQVFLLIKLWCLNSIWLFLRSSGNWEGGSVVILGLRIFVAFQQLSSVISALMRNWVKPKCILHRKEYF